MRRGRKNKLDPRELDMGVVGLAAPLENERRQDGFSLDPAALLEFISKTSGIKTTVDLLKANIKSENGALFAYVTGLCFILVAVVVMGFMFLDGPGLRLIKLLVAFVDAYNNVGGPNFTRDVRG